MVIDVSSDADRTVTVLVVEDEANLLDLYEVWLAEAYTVRTALTGAAARDELDSTVDVMVLDRRMPDLSGDALLRQLRAEGWTGPVGLVSAAEPDFDLLELAFDAHLNKPVTREQLLAIVSRLIEVGTLDPEARALYRQLVKRTLLQETKNLVELAGHEAYETLEAGVEEAMASLDDDRVEAVKHLVP